MTRQEILDEIRELDALRFEHVEAAHYVYNRINELLDQLRRVEETDEKDSQ